MKDYVIESPFRLSTGGFVYELMERLGLVKANRYQPWRRITIFSGLAWVPLLVLSAIDGTLAGSAVDIIFIKDPVVHSRFLIALPILFFADWIIDPFIAGIVKYLETSDLVPDAALGQYRKSFNQLTHLRDAVWVDGCLIVLAFGSIWLLQFKFGMSTLYSGSSSWMSSTTGGAEELTIAGWWLILCSIPLIQFFLYRWIWRFIIWVRFLNQLSKIPLEIQPTHPDQSGGLGLLDGGQFLFGVIFSTIGIQMSSVLASDILYAGRKLADLYFEISGFVLISIIIIILPLCTFSVQLANAKRIGLRRFSVLGYQLSEVFQNEWINKTKGQREDGLVTDPDPSALADYIAVYETISSMGWIPFNRQKMIRLSVILIAPFLPLVLTQFSMKEALSRVAQLLV